MPLNGRNVYSLISLVPGVTPTGGGGINVSIGGGMQQQNVTYLDGAPLNTGYFNSTAGSVSQDAVQEFRVQTNSMSAEFGRTAGGVINLTSRSGTNEFHGSAYEFMRNKVLNANTFFSNKAGLAEAAFYTESVRRDLWRAHLERTKRSFSSVTRDSASGRGRTYTLSTPIEAWRKGDFSDLRDSTGKLIPIYDPLTICGKYNNPACAVDSKGSPIYVRKQFPGNIIPSNRIDATAKALIPLFWGLPNQAGQPYTHAFNFTTNASTGSSTNQYNVTD